MDILDRKGWTIEFWLTLTDNERVDWLAWQKRRERQLEALLRQMKYDKTETADSGEQVVKHYVHDYGAYIDILKELYR